MNGLPPSVPLPPEVRERALGTVLAGMDAAPRTRAPFLAAAAAVVVALTVSVAVALSSSGPADPVPPAAGPTLSPATSGPAATGDPVTDRALLRCAAAVEKSGRAASYPPTSGWKVTAVLFHASTGETAIAIDDAFACFVGATDVWLSSPDGTPVGGGVEVAQLTPATVVVLNPQRRAVTMPADAISNGRTALAATAPVQLMEVGATGAGAGYPIKVEGAYEGPLPVAAPIVVTVEDRESQTRAPAPGSLATDGAALDACLTASMPGAQPGLRHGVPGVPAAVAATVGDGRGGFCVAGARGPVFAAGAIPPADGRTGLVVVANAAGAGVTGALIAVPRAVTRVEITAGGLGAVCSFQDGLALCTLPGTAGATVAAYQADGSGFLVLLN
jgi:hypothetical protein